MRLLTGKGGKAFTNLRFGSHIPVSVFLRQLGRLICRRMGNWINGKFGQRKVGRKGRKLSEGNAKHLAGVIDEGFEN